MTGLLEIRLPDEVMDNLPSEKEAMIVYLSKHFDEVIRNYEQEFTRSVGGFLGQPLSRYEKATIKDFLIRMVLGRKLSQQFDDTSPFEKIEAVAVTK